MRIAKVTIKRAASALIPGRVMLSSAPSVELFILRQADDTESLIALPIEEIS